MIIDSILSSGSDESGDLDIIITRDPSDGVDHAGRLHGTLAVLPNSPLGVLPELLERLRATGLLVGDLGGETNEGLEAKYMGVCRLSSRDKVRRIGQ